MPRGQNATSVLLTGAVLRPGPLPYDQAPDLVTAVVRSGGVAADADQNQVQVIRQSGERSMRIRVNLNKAMLRPIRTWSPAIPFSPHGRKAPRSGYTWHR